MNILSIRNRNTLVIVGFITTLYLLFVIPPLQHKVEPRSLNYELTTGSNLRGTINLKDGKIELEYTAYIPDIIYIDISDTKIDIEVDPSTTIHSINIISDTCNTSKNLSLKGEKVLCAQRKLDSDTCECNIEQQTDGEFISTGLHVFFLPLLPLISVLLLVILNKVN